MLFSHPLKSPLHAQSVKLILPMALAHFSLILFFFTTLHAQPFPSQHDQDAALQASLFDQACTNTSDPHRCAADLHIECQRSGLRGPIPLLHAAVTNTLNNALRAIDSVSGHSALTDNLREQMALDDCVELLGYSIDQLRWSLTEMSRTDTDPSSTNLRSYLSAALSNQDTCLEGFDGTDGRLRHHIARTLIQVSQLVSNVLAMNKRLRSIIMHVPRPVNGTDVRFPPWVGEEGQEVFMHGEAKTMRVDAVVAQDGSGGFRSVSEAVDAAPSHSARRYVIHVKKGVYRENVELKKKKTNIAMIGDGMGVTIITGSRNFMQGWTTFRTATFAVSGQGFIARDITFRNTAGPQNRQAVALRVDSDRSAFFRCSIEGYQDTLYAHSLRQFYRECHIHGTIDFIFGNGQIVLQNCKIFTRQPLPGQKVTVSAQGRKDVNQNTGFSFHGCFVYATSPTYLGRPWKLYSRTVFMQSYLSSQVQPQGWLEWMGDFGLDTLFYGEYMNYGPGSGLGGRVRWGGYHVLRDASVASFFTVRRFIDGLSWLRGTGVPFTADLLK